MAKKYGVSYTCVGEKARAEGWIEEREQFRSKSYSKTLDELSKGQAKRATRLQTIADKLLDKIEKAVDNFEMVDLMTDRTALKQITGALKDIKEIQMIKSVGDMREQEARIKNLEKQAETDTNDSDIQIVMEKSLEEYSE